jgi:hypothetical protein
MVKASDIAYRAASWEPSMPSRRRSGHEALLPALCIAKRLTQ